MILDLEEISKDLQVTIVACSLRKNKVDDEEEAEEDETFGSEDT